jgi:D-arabinose 1-dehydrogenase-like Zn-dependent alcohol dehydrogenase
VVGRIEATGSEANTFIIGDRVGIAWISLSVEHASSVWQAMKVYVRVSKLPVEM